MANNPWPVVAELPPALLMTRPEAASEAFVADLAQRVVLGPVVISPVLEIVGLPHDPVEPGVAGIILTSAHALAHYRGPVSVPAYCVGPRTTQAARAAGFDAVQAGETADALVDFIVSHPPTGPIVHLHGRHTRGNVAPRLRHAGINVQERAIYDQQSRPLTSEAHALLDGERPVILPLFSPRSALLVCEEIGGHAPRWVVAMSESVRDAAAQANARRMIVAPRPDGAAMCAAVSGLYPTNRPVEGGRVNA